MTQPQNMVFGVKPAGPVAELFIFLAVDPEGNEQVCSYFDPAVGVVMMMTGALDAIEHLMPRAHQMVRGTGLTIKVKRFSPDADAVAAIYDDSPPVPPKPL